MRGAARDSIQDELALASRNARKNRSFQGDARNLHQLGSRMGDDVRGKEGTRIRFADQSNTQPMQMKPQTSLVLREISKVRREMYEQSLGESSADRRIQKDRTDLIQILQIENVYTDFFNAIKSAFPSAGA